jgi:hypothetical protein
MRSVGKPKGSRNIGRWTQMDDNTKINFKDRMGGSSVSGGNSGRP